MTWLQPTSWADALAAKSAHPEALPVQGGTDVMVELNFGRSRPDAILDLSRVPELRDWSLDGEHVRIGAGVTYVRVIDELAAPVPGLAIAARTVGSPQIRNTGTVGGNLGAASPAGDSHPPLLAARAVYEVASQARGVRLVPAASFYVGPKRNALEPDELIAAILVPVAAGPQQFAKIGRRNAMVIAASSFAISLDPVARAVGTGMGSVGPTPLRAPAAEAFLADALSEHDLWETDRPLDRATLERFGELVAEAATPIDDVRATAEYRGQTLSVMARRTATWALATRRSVR